MNVLGTPSIDSWNDLHTLPDSGKIHFESVPPVNCWFKVGMFNLKNFGFEKWEFSLTLNQIGIYF